MSVVLRDVETGLYWQEAQWTAQRPEALAFQGISEALERAARPGLENVEVVVSCPEGDLLLPIKGAAPSEILFFVQQWAP